MSHEHKVKARLTEDGKFLLEQFDKIATRLGVLVNGLHPIIPDAFHTPSYFGSIPTLNMLAKLHVQLYHKNLQAKVELNDFTDVNHLALAVPNCDVVVCDKKMDDAIKKAGLDAWYGSVVFKKLADAVDWLEMNSPSAEGK